MTRPGGHSPRSAAAAGTTSDTSAPDLAQAASPGAAGSGSFTSTSVPATATAPHGSIPVAPPYDVDRVRQTADGIPRLYRRREHSVLGGVASGLAEHLRVQVLWVRLTFAVLTLMAGSGVVAYALLWIFVRPAPPDVPPRRFLGDLRAPAEVAGREVDAAQDRGRSGAAVTATERRQAIGVAALGTAMIIAAAASGFGQVLGWVLGPLGLAAIGAAFIWREADDARRARWRRTAVGLVGPRGSSWWRLGGGIALVVGGLSVFALGQLDFTAFRSALIAVVLTLIGVAVISVPWWVRLVRDLGAERSARAAAAERAEIAAHLHDSVLQTLALIQRQAGQNREVLRLARAQERELRTWLYGPAGYAAPDGAAAHPVTTLAAALAAAAGEVEDTYLVAVSPVVVGDIGMDPHLAALVAAAREAMVNAAKHAGVEEVSVYAEVERGTATVYVRDRGRGFDPSAVDPDRRGLAESIRGRMERHGGHAAVNTKPGQGTEVELSVSIDSAPGSSPEPGAPSRPADSPAAEPSTASVAPGLFQ